LPEPILTFYTFQVQHARKRAVATKHTPSGKRLRHVLLSNRIEIVIILIQALDGKLVCNHQ
jgi:hypothetical protein